MALKPQESRLILLDVDGVIVDSFDLLYTNLSAMIKEKLGKDLTRDQYREFFRGNPLQEILKFIGLGSLLHVRREDLAKIFDGYNQCRIYDGMKELMATLAKQHTIAIVTSTPNEIVQPKFEQEGIDQYVAAYLGAETSSQKDEKIRLVMSEFDIDRERTWFVTDTSGDLDEAHRTAVHTVAATWGYHPRAWLEATSPEYVVDSPAELLKLLNG